MKNQELTDFLEECGVCAVCQLRYLKARGSEYKHMKETFQRLNVKIGEENNDCDPVCKKARRNVCPTCLGMFSAEFQELLIQGIMSTDIAEFECDEIVIAISLPMVLQTRQLSMWYALQRKFKNSSIDDSQAPDVPLKEAVKLILNPQMCEKLKKGYDANGIMINIQLQHVEEQHELHKLRNLHDEAFPTKNGKRQPEISRGLLEKLYTPAQIDMEVFVKYLPVPPSIPSAGLTLKQLTLTGPTVFVAGRYRKMTRTLSHTPWVLNGVRVMEDSIEEIIIRTIAPYFCADQTKVIFMSSGREDVDVRCLGKGRPFVLEIPNARRTRLQSVEAHKMEQEIDASMRISVRNLQMVTREELVHIKTGEEKKRKFYRALCLLEQPATAELLEKLQLPQGFEIQQKTPIRVLHRRPLHTRPRSVYSLTARVQRDNTRALVLDIVSQAGTYIKELVHGEFGRTAPSIASIIGQPIDIIALDVVAIDLDWPSEIDNGF